VKLSIA